jgi:hypothetical protein
VAGNQCGYALECSGSAGTADTPSRFSKQGNHDGRERQRRAHQERGQNPNTKGNAPQHQGGDAARKAQEWGGGNKAAKGLVTKADKQNENSSSKS